VAKTLAPSVIYIDEVEKVFVSDKKKANEFGGQVPNRKLQFSIHSAGVTPHFMHTEFDTEA
jgi:hypothetical protein